MHIHKRKIYGFDCDLYGHMNNARYLNIFEEARSEAMEVTDYPIDTLFEMGFFIYVRDLKLEYIKSIPVNSLITIESKITHYSRLKSTWEQVIKNEKEEICSRLILNAVFTKNGKPIRLPKPIYNGLAKMVD